MKHRIQNESGIYKYLKASGVLGQSSEAIEAARRVYWNQYKRKWKKAKFKQEKAFTVSFNPIELKEISDAAALHSLSRSRFIKLAALAYVHKKYLVPNIEAIYQVKTLLSLNYSALQELFDENIVPYSVGIELMSRMEQMEHEILKQLMHPKSVNIDS